MSTLSPFLGPAAQIAKKRVFGNRGNEIFPGIKSDDPEYLRFTERLADRLTESFPSEQDDEGVNGENAITGDFYSLRTVSGYRMNPRTIPTVDNTQLVGSLGLATTFNSDRHRAIFEELHRVLYAYWKPSDVKVARLSSSTFPFFVRDVDYKVQHASYVMENLETICKQILSDDLERVFTDHKVLMAAAINYRSQVDKVIRDNDRFKSKDRLVNDLEYAISGGSRGQRFPADKSVIIDNQVIKGHFAMRERPVYGMSAPINYAITSIMQGYRDHYLSEYAFTFKHTTSEQIESKINQFRYMRGFDVSQFDESNQTWMLHHWMDAFGRDWPEWLIEVMKLMLHAPYYTPAVSNEGGDGIWMGNPFKLDNFKLNLGLPSGIAPNPDIGKFMMTFTYMCFIDDYFGDVLEFGLDKVLKGEHPRYGLLDMSDDAIILTNSEGFRDHISAVLKKEGVISNYFAAAKEDSVSFLGNVVYRKRGETKVSLCPDVRSFVLNWFCPERGVQDRMREYWATGWFERALHYSKSPAYSDVSLIVREEFRKSFGLSPDTIASDHLLDVPPLNIEATSAVDYAVLMDPSKLFYRFEQKDVSPEVYDHFIAKIPVEVVKKTVLRHYKG